LPHVFELFTQGDRSLDRSQGGLGIGLTLARTLAELHGGSLMAHSDGPGQGSEFVLRLPVAAVRPSAADKGHAAGAAAAGPVRRRVLVVDDNRDAVESLAVLLRARGHVVETAFDGGGALTVAARFRPDVVLLDIGLPGMDGYEVARRLRRELRPAPLLVALTGYGQEEDRRLALAAGFDEHVVKPASLPGLTALLQRAGLPT